jgi:endogenous inhibitor of DNA gyrase (YacG/DUF329 family)
MIPISVTDIRKILEEFPLWKAVANLPKRLAELERRIAALEGGAAAKPAPLTGRECPICGAAMKVVAEKPHPQFGYAGDKLHEMKCPECGETAQRYFVPGKGYRLS